MKKIINALRDLIYNITDYGLIITVILVMTIILVWRFDLLFSRGIDKEIIKDLPIVNQPVAEKPEPAEEEPEPDTDPDKEPVTEPEPNDETPAGVIATISIPQGSFK